MSLERDKAGRVPRDTSVQGRHDAEAFRLLGEARSSYWVYPTLLLLAGAAAAFGLTVIDERLGDPDGGHPFHFIHHIVTAIQAANLIEAAGGT